MNTTIKIIRVLWVNKEYENTFNEVPIIPTYPNQIVYVWGEEINKHLLDLGYQTRLIQDNTFNETSNTEYGRKLIALDLALQEFGEVLLLDWDCHILRPFDNNFYNYLQSKPIQCPLYTQHVDTTNALYEVFIKDDETLKKFKPFAEEMERSFNKYSWKVEEGLVSPNFCCVYSRDKNFAKELIDISLKNDIKGCVEEHAMWIYSNCSLEEYLEKYQPLFVQGVSDDRTDHSFRISQVQRKLNSYIDSKLPMDLYLKHI